MDAGAPLESTGVFLWFFRATLPEKLPENTAMLPENYPRN